MRLGEAESEILIDGCAVKKLGHVDLRDER